MSRRAGPAYRLFLVYLGWGSIFLSCLSRPAVPVRPPASAPAPGEVPPPRERVAALVKRDDPALLKYFVQDEAAGITVRADLEDCEVLYDVRNARPSPDKSRWALDFSVRERGTGAVLRDTLWWTLPDGDAGILLALDDDYLDRWRHYFDLFDRYGAVVTFFVIGEPSSFCREALDRGHDIGCHTRSHLNLLKVSRELFFEEALSTVAAFRQAGIPLRSFAYPFGLSEPWMREALAGTFRIQRGFGVRYHIYSRKDLAAGYIASISIDNIIYKTNAEFESVLTTMLRALKFIGGDSLIPLTTHDIADDADWGISPRRLEFLLQTARDLKLRFYRYGDL
jgi:peptidoglycan/xylan/chitin deacetylase (PgdA/CDA1 family)